jgi:sugar O-acyltransferase (sialic acid O-acetyltransferase NeuD family)
MSAKKKIVIFGTSAFAEVVDVYLTKDSPYEVVAFTAHKKQINKKKFRGKNVVPFEDLTGLYPPNKYSMFVAVGYSKLNRFRTQIYEQCRTLGYEMISYINSKAVQWGEIKVGENVFILENNVIQPFVEIGNNTILWSGNHIGHHSVVGNNVFISSHVVISGKCKIGDNCFIGVNVAIADGVAVAPFSFIGMGAMITKDTMEKGVYKGVKSVAEEYTTDEMRGL